MRFRITRQRVKKIYYIYNYGISDYIRKTCHVKRPYTEDTPRQTALYGRHATLNSLIRKKRHTKLFSELMLFDSHSQYSITCNRSKVNFVRNQHTINKCNFHLLERIILQSNNAKRHNKATWQTKNRKYKYIQISCLYQPFV